jgi:hypothetical protein
MLVDNAIMARTELGEAVLEPVLDRILIAPPASNPSMVGR